MKKLVNSLSRIMEAANHSKNTAMEAENHEKHGIRLKSRIIIVLAFLLPISLAAQIRLAEDKPPPPKEPEWMKYKDIIFAPYDSSYLHVKMYPTLEAYNKYIGQQLYFPCFPKAWGRSAFKNDRQEFLLLYSDDWWIRSWGTEGTRDFGSDTCFVWHPRRRHDREKNIIPGNNEFAVGKYYTIIGIESIADKKFIKHHRRENYGPFPLSASIASDIYAHYRIGGSAHDNDIWRYGESRSLFRPPREEAPYFILKETESGDIVYTAVPQYFIIVGAFVKMQQKFIGQNAYKIERMPAKHNINDSYNFIEEKWICTDVVLREDKVNLVFQNAEDTTKEIEKDPRSIFGDFIWETAYNEAVSRALDELAEEEMARKERELKNAQENAAYRQRLAQEAAKRKQELTSKYGAATAEKIIAGKLEIGMSKAVCREIVKYASVAEKTATTETWKIRRIAIAGSVSETYLYFTGDKLTRIVNR